jgi:hypothetical protein
METGCRVSFQKLPGRSIFRIADLRRQLRNTVASDINFQHVYLHLHLELICAPHTRHPAVGSAQQRPQSARQCSCQYSRSGGDMLASAISRFLSAKSRIHNFIPRAPEVCLLLYEGPGQKYGEYPLDRSLA